MSMRWPSPKGELIRWKPARDGQGILRDWPIDWEIGSSKFGSHSRLRGTTFRHAVAVIHHPWEAGGVYTVGFDPLCHREEVRIANRICLAHYPGTNQQAVLDVREARADGLRHLAPHRSHGSRIVGHRLGRKRWA